MRVGTIRVAHRAHGQATVTPPKLAQTEEEPGWLESFAGRWVDNMVLLSHFVGVGQAYKMAGSRIAQREAEHPPLKDVPLVQLKRPFVMVPGWTTRLERFQALGDRLTEGGRNGGEIVFLKNGDFFHDRACTRPMDEQMIATDSKVFEVLLEDPHEPPPVVADELERDFEAVRRVTGADKVDVDAYSMGGLGTRVYLDRGGDAVGKLLLLGTPNRGTRFADLAGKIIRRDIQFAMSMAGIGVGDSAALEWLAVDDGEGRNNPQLTDLNRNWARQVRTLEAVHTVGGKALLTPSRGWWLFTGGDGLVETDGLAPPGGTVRVLEGEKHHGYLNSDPDVYREMMDFFDWEPDPSTRATA